MTLGEQKKFIDSLRREKQHERPTDSISAAALQNEIAALGEVWVSLNEMEKLLTSLKFLQSRQDE